MLKNSFWKKTILITGMVLLLLSLAGCQASSKKEQPAKPGTNVTVPGTGVQKEQAAKTTDSKGVSVKKGQSYSTSDEVAAYIYEFKTLPPNFITKNEAGKLGWDNSKGNLWKVTDKKSIGGDRFGNFEGKLPKAGGRQYYECDIDYAGGYRGAKRIVYSSDGLIFYTDDHYKTFKQLNPGGRK